MEKATVHPQESRSERIKREKEAYNQQALERDGYSSVLSHADRSPANEARVSEVRETMKMVHQKIVLEIGSSTWNYWLDFDNHPPKSLTCLNISEAELDHGRNLCQQRNLKIKFMVGDAHDMPFPDNSFDYVFGGGILHHLEFEKGVHEINRVLKPGGSITFTEPLRANPISKIIRLMTPRARTRDELPLGRRELKFLNQIFDTRCSYHLLTSVPAGLLSRLLFKSADNFMMRAAFALDRLIIKSMPFLGLFFRNVLIAGTSRKANS